MRKLHVVRMDPPELGTCHAPGCERRIEWVKTVAGDKWLPVNAPLTALATYARQDDLPRVTVIDAATNHFTTCVAAAVVAPLGHRRPA
jgi:hypothetical protein